MAEIDTGVYNKLIQGPSVPEALNAFTNMSNSLTHNAYLSTQNAVLGQQFRANKAMGGVMQQAVDPQTGTVDYDKAVTLMAQNPDTAYLAPEFMSKIYANKGQALENKLKEMQLVAARQKLFGDAAGSLLQYGEGVTKDKVFPVINDLYRNMVSSGLSDDKTMDELLNFAAALPDKGPDLNQRLKGIALQGSGAADSLNKVLGSFQTFDVGGRKILGYTNPVNGAVNYVGQLDMTPTPEQRNAPITTVGPDGSTSVTPRQDALPMYSGTGAPVNVPGAQPGTLPPPAVGGAPGAPVPTSPSGSVMTKLPPETAEWLQGRGKNAVDYAKNLQEEVSGVQTQLQFIQQLKDFSKDFKPGAGAEMLTKLGSLAQAVGMPRETVDRVANGSLAASQAFQKYSVQNTMNVLRQAIGGQGRLTNLEFEQFLHSNPNLDTDPRAIDKILSFSQKLYKIKLAEQKGLNDWVKSGHAPADFPPAWTQTLIKRNVLRAAQDSDLSSDKNWKWKK